MFAACGQVVVQKMHIGLVCAPNAGEEGALHYFTIDLSAGYAKGAYWEVLSMVRVGCTCAICKEAILLWCSRRRVRCATAKWEESLHWCSYVENALHYFTIGGNALVALYALYALVLPMGGCIWEVRGQGGRGVSSLWKGSTEI